MKTSDGLRHDPVLAALYGKLEAKRADCAPLAGKLTLNRLEHAPNGAATRYHKIGHDGRAIERLFVDLFLDAHAVLPCRHARSSISTRPIILCTAIRKAASFTATTTVPVTAICRSTETGAIGVGGGVWVPHRIVGYA